MAIALASVAFTGVAQADTQHVRDAGAPVAAPAAAPVKGTVTSRIGVNVRQYPTSNSKIVGSYRYRQVIDLVCKKTNGQPVNGNRVWYKVNKPNGWVTARFVKNHAEVPLCK
ncbi:SH3 domain-containing protein [Streptomyces sp. Je 1-369]|nr:SH3 domain-containing protein [Streptomyces sp. Je 1-369]WAL99198.1 SH3 domain-containing protein [Streptomyces sp. Je 1-369]